MHIPNKAVEITWHSYVTIEADTVTLWLRKRKNEDQPSAISRRCICNSFPLACGHCSLIKQINARKGSAVYRSRLFPNVKASGANLIKKICVDKGLGYFTWHGPRRGRLEDLVKGKDRSNNPNPTMTDAYESGMYSL